jgi:dihydroneopterin aldolase
LSRNTSAPVNRSYFAPHRCRRTESDHVGLESRGYNRAVDTILLERIEFYGFHGASDEEQAVGRRYSVDTEIRFDTAIAGRTDALTDTIDYGAVAGMIVEIGTVRQFRLLEALAEAMAQAVLADFPVDSVRITVRKLHPPVPHVVAASGVAIERYRSAIDSRVEA